MPPVAELFGRMASRVGIADQAPAGELVQYQLVSMTLEAEAIQAPFPPAMLENHAAPTGTLFTAVHVNPPSCESLAYPFAPAESDCASCKKSPEVAEVALLVEEMPGIPTVADVVLQFVPSVLLIFDIPLLLGK